MKTEEKIKTAIRVLTAAQAAKAEVRTKVAAKEQEADAAMEEGQQKYTELMAEAEQIEERANIHCSEAEDELIRVLKAAGGSFSTVLLDGRLYSLEYPSEKQVVLKVEEASIAVL